MKKNIILFIASILLSILLAEIITALFCPSIMVKKDTFGRASRTNWPKGYKIPNSKIWVLVPNSKGRSRLLGNWAYNYSINSLGIRNSEISPIKEKNTKRILVLGDSIVYGIGAEAENTFPKVLEQKLNSKNLRFSFEVINAGIPGYSTAEELALLKRIGPIIEPDIVIVCFYADYVLSECEGNDLWKNYIISAKHTLLQKDGSVKKGSWIREIKNWLTRHSHLYYFLVTRIYRPLINYKSPYEISFRHQQKEKKAVEKLNRAWDITEDIFLDIYKEVKKYNAETIIVYIPQPLTIITKDTRINERIASFSKRTGIKSLSLNKILQHLDIREITFRNDRHLNKLGNKIVGEYIANFLISLQ